MPCGSQIVCSSVDSHRYRFAQWMVLQVASHHGTFRIWQDDASQHSCQVSPFIVALPVHLNCLSPHSVITCFPLGGCSARQVACQKNLDLAGNLLINGQPIETANIRQGYVQQEDMFFSQLTVRYTCHSPSYSSHSSCQSAPQDHSLSQH